MEIYGRSVCVPQFERIILIINYFLQIALLLEVVVGLICDVESYPSSNSNHKLLMYHDVQLISTLEIESFETPGFWSAFQIKISIVSFILFTKEAVCQGWREREREMWNEKKGQHIYSKTSWLKNVKRFLSWSL